MKNINKYISYIFIIFFLIIFSFYNFEEYKSFHQSKIELENRNKNLNEKIESFKLKYVEDIKNINFYYTPNRKLLDNIINKINNSKKTIFLETYILTEKRTQEALIKAHKRWIEIKVLLEKAPYKAYNINNKSFNKLKKAWINIKWSDKQDYTLNHSKVLLIDDLSIISTWNYSYSTFTKNRDFFIFTTDKNINKKLKQNFDNDFNWNKINIYDDNLVFSPNTSRIKFEKIFNYAKKDIKMYFQYLKDDDLVNLLIKIKKEKNININIILPITAKDDKNIRKIENAWIKIHFFKKYKIHAKAILVDWEYLFIWSINFSDYSLNKNREVWILIKNKKIIYDFLNIYNQDIKNSF